MKGKGSAWMEEEGGAWRRGGNVGGWLLECGRFVLNSVGWTWIYPSAM